MDNNNKKKGDGNDNAKQFVIQEEFKHIYGAYFNMARDNYYKTISYILNGLGIKLVGKRNIDSEWVEVPLIDLEKMHIFLYDYKGYWLDHVFIEPTNK